MNPQPTASKNWDGSTLARQLLRAHDDGASVFAVCGMSGHHFGSVQAQFEATLAQEPRTVLVLDPTGRWAKQQTLTQCLDVYVQRVDALGRLSEEAEELISWLHTTRGSEPRGSRDESQRVMGRLWQMLSAVLPSVLVILDGARAQDQEHIVGLARHYFSDPIAELMPEYGTESPHGPLMVFATPSRQPEEWMQSVDGLCQIDVYEYIERHLKDYLSRRDVVERLMQTTQGDIAQIDRLIGDLGQNIQRLSMHRYADMSPHFKRIVQVLALGGGPLPMRMVMDCLARLDDTEPSTHAIKALIKSGDVRRHIKLGDVHLSLADEHLAQGVKEQMSEQLAGQLNTYLSELALAEGGEVWSVRGLEYAVRAQRADVIEQQGLGVVRSLLARGEFRSAWDVLQTIDSLLPQDDASKTQALSLRMELSTRLGKWRGAIETSHELEALVVPGQAMCELLYRRSQLWSKINEHQHAVECVDVALEHACSDGLVPKLALARSKSLYQLGQHKESQAWAQRAIDEVEARGELMSRMERARTQLLARNVLGKIAGGQGRYAQARGYFEQNVEQSHEWGWVVLHSEALGNLGALALMQSDYERAQIHLNEALEMADAMSGLPRGLCLLNLGVVYQHRVEYERALRTYLDSMRVATQEEEHYTYCLATYNVATLYRDLGAYSRAERMVEHINDKIEGVSRNPFVLGRHEDLLVSVYLRQGRPEEVIQRLSALDGAEPGEDYGELLKRLRLAQACVMTQQWGRAHELIATVERVCSEEDEKLRARAWAMRARLMFHQGQHERALELARQATPVLERMGKLYESIENDLIISLCFEELSRADEARALLSRLANQILEVSSGLPSEFVEGFNQVDLHGKIATHMVRLGMQAPTALLPKTQAVLDTDDLRFQAWRARYAHIVGRSPKLYQIFKVLDRVATSATPLLVTGESGTGKELIAQSLHELSDRAKGPFVKVNCAAFVDSLLLSELFGHEKGAFTGAMSQKVGRFEMADGGTLFLDEIADISHQTQVALLRVLQEGEFERVGGTKTIGVNVRLVCATNKNLEEMVQRGEFRLDLYYRLKGMIVESPALRERRQDVPLLVEHFAQQFAQASEPKRFSKEVLRHLMRYSWPGNIRELQNFVRSVLLFVEGAVVEREHLKEFEDFFSSGTFIARAPVIEHASELVEPIGLSEISDFSEAAPSPAAAPTTSQNPEDALVSMIVNQETSLHELKQRLEIESIKRALIQARGNVTKTATILQMKRPRLSQIINGSEELVQLKQELTA